MAFDLAQLPPFRGEYRQHGGFAIADSYGTEYLREIGQAGGETCCDRYGREYMAVIGRAGGATTAARYGIEHYRRMGVRSGEARRAASSARRNKHKHVKEASNNDQSPCPAVDATGPGQP